MIHAFFLCFVPLFVAVDAVGVLPFFLSLTATAPVAQRRRIVLQSVLTAVLVALIFLWLGQAVLRLLGITVQDFMIAGGLLLFVIAMRDMLTLDVRRGVVDLESLGVVPIGVPLITGPAVLTTSLLLLNEQGAAPTALAIVVNIALAGGILAGAGLLYKVLGNAGTRAVSKIASLLLAAIAVMMVRKGVVQLIGGLHAG